MATRWITFSNPVTIDVQVSSDYHEVVSTRPERLRAACFSGTAAEIDEAVRAIEARDAVVARQSPIPYPATPCVRLASDLPAGRCPRFCHAPAQCKGRTACPQSYACSE